MRSATMSAAVDLAMQSETRSPLPPKRTSVLRKVRRPSNAGTSSTGLSSRTSSPAISGMATTGAGPSYSASASASTSSCTTGSSIMFAQDVTYESDDGTDDFFARRLVRDLARAEQSSRQGSPIPPVLPPSEPTQTTWVSSPDLMHGWELQREGYFTPPTSPPVVAVAHAWEPHAAMSVSPANLPPSSGPSGSFTSASPAPPTTTGPAGTPDPPPARRKPTKLRKGRASIPNESNPALSACPPASSNAFRFLRRFSTSKQREEPDPTPVQVPRHNSAPPPEVHQQAPLSAVDIHNSMYARPTPYVLPPAVSPTTPTEVFGDVSFYSSRYVTSDPGHGGSLWDESSFGHGVETTPATSEDIHQLAFPFLPNQKQAASRTQPPVPQLPAALMHLRREPVMQLSPRRKPVPVAGDDADLGNAIGRAFLDTDVERVPAEERPDTMPELVSDDSWRSSEPTIPVLIPEVKSTLRPQLHRRPPLLRREPSRRWSMGMGLGSDTRLRAALCAQEIVQTENNYREVLGKLLRAETMTTPPPELLDLVPALLSASPRFASPAQAGALATTFIESVHALEHALVDWCTVAGPFFNPLGSGSRSRSTSALSSLSSPTRRPASLLTSPALSRNRRLSITAAWDQLWDPAVPVSEVNSADRTVGSGLRRRTLVSERSRRASRAHLFERLGLDLARSSPSIAVSSPAGSASSADPGPGPNKNPKRPTVADLAIQPTQRAVRYVLLFRELLDLTTKLAAAEGVDGGGGGDVPQVREALDEALRLARACDGALPQRLG